jgi:hypothetical protein
MGFSLRTVILICGAAGLLSADTLTLRSGETIQGTFLGGTARQIRMDLNGEIRTFDIDRVQSVIFNDAQGQSYAAPAPVLPPPPPDRYTQNAPPPVSGGIFIPADTEIRVRMIDAVNSDSAYLGQMFKASLDEPVVVNGQTVIPRGADVMTKLVQADQSGKIQGRTVMTLALSTITINGRPVDVTSTDVRSESKSRGARSGEVIGGTAALGAIIGAIAGGGKGAAIGAGSGAAVGTGAEVLTSGQKVRIPSETRLSFRLQSPIQL